MASVTSLGVHEPAGLLYAINEGILPANAGPDQYDWKLFDDENGEDELFTTATCVVWSRGGEVGRCLRFDVEQEPISTALLAYFPTSEDDVGATLSTAAKTATTNSPSPASNSSSSSYSKPASKPGSPPLAKSLIVFLRTRAHVYSFSGGEYIVHMPFEVDSAIAAPRGVIIQRKSKVDNTVPMTLRFPRVPPNSFVSSQILPPQLSFDGASFSTAGLGKPKPLPLRLSSTLDTMWDTPLQTSDLGWPRLVCLTDPMSEIGLVVTQPEKATKDRYPRSSGSQQTPFLDPAEEILHVELIKKGPKNSNPKDELVLAVTVNRETSMYSVWRMTYLNGDDQLTRRQKSKTDKANTSAPKDSSGGTMTGNGGNRRRSSMAPNLASGATTPHVSSFRERESMGPPQPMKRTRKSERLEREREKNNDNNTIEKALSMETGRISDVSRRQSRRASSHLARADLSASHERPMFPDAPGQAINLGASTSSAAGGRRVDSHGSQRGRNSSGYGGGAGGGNVHFSHTLNSLLESPVDGLLEELRSGGDFEGFHNMGLDDPEFDGLTKEVLFTKVHSMSMDTTNLRYSFLNRPAAKLCKVFIIVGTPYSVDEQDRNYLLVCIQDVIDKRLQLLTLHVQVRGDMNLSGTAIPGMPPSTATSITWGQHRKAQNVADSCVIHDGDQSMIFILSEGDNGHRQLSIQAPWSELTTISFPPLSLHNRNLFSTPADNGIFQSAKGGEFGVSIKSLCHPRGKGVIDVVDEQDRLHQVQIQLEPRSARVRQILNVLRSVLPCSHSEKILLGWWQLMQWLNDMQLDAPSQDKEWTALVTELCIIFLAALGPSGGEIDRDQHAALAVCASNARMDNLTPPWAMSKAWNWASSGTTSSPVSSFRTAIYHGSGTSTDVNDGPLAEPLCLAKLFMATEAGDQAVGDAGYLPTASSAPESSRQKTLWGITMALHLLLEEEKLDIMSCGLRNSIGLKTVVHQMCTWLKWPAFAEAYALELPNSALATHSISASTATTLSITQPEEVPNISDWIRQRLTGQKTGPFLSLRVVFAVLLQQNPRDAQRNDDIWKDVTPRTLMFRRFFDEVTPFSSSAHVLETMHKCGFTPGILNTLPEGMATPFQDAIARCQQRPPSHWSKELYELVGRGDMNTVLKAEQLDASGGGNASNTVMQALYKKPPAPKDEEDAASSGAVMAADEPESEERQIVIQALFRDDKRLFEAQNLLSSSKPRVVQLQQQPGWTEPQYLERQKEFVTEVATGTLATSAGRGMLNYGFQFPLLTQKFNVQGFNLTCIVRPSNVAVAVDKAMFTEEKVNWAFFHQGVAYGLAISARAKGIDTSWIVFNKPGTDLSHRHAGFLLALGLNGHLKSVAKWVAFKYLTPKHMMTSIGLLLGLAVSHLGTMDSLITRLLSVHVTRMLPRGAAELNLSHQIQTTGIFGIGLLYYNTQHRRMSEIMMSEIEYMDDEDEEDPLRNEGYRLAAAYALGFINLGKGSDRKGLLDMHITEQLLSLASSNKKVELVNVLDRAAPAATIALALIYMKTEDRIVARKIDIPEASMQFDYVRPDVLLLRTLAKNLIMWSEIRATPDWIRSNLPAEFRERYNLEELPKLRAQDLPFFAIIAGLCFAIALRFAGSGNTGVRDLLVHYLDRFIEIVEGKDNKAAASFDAQLARGGARLCLDVLSISCATVMAGTGDIKVLRRLRLLHGRVDVQTPYGSHMAAHLAIGTLFLGSGTTTFGNNNLAIAALLVAFYPIFPATVQDNGSHLQAFRHFWVLATEPRCLVTKDAATGQPISVPIMVYLKPSALSIASGDTSGSTPTGAPQSPEDTVQRRQTPCLLPPLDDIIAIRTDAVAQGFWDLEVGFERDPSLRTAFQTNQNLYLRRRPAHESVFSTTLQALSRSANVTANLTSDSNKYGSGGDPLEWLFGLDTFKDLSLAERSFVLGEDGADGSGSGNVSSLSSVVDARLALAGGLSSGWGRDRLQDMRLLFDWADNRSARLDADRAREAEVDGLGNSKGKEPKEGKGKDKSSDGLLPPWPSTDKDKGSVDWWMSDSAIDKLKGKVWLIGQE